jgi:hypothetical protein
LRFARRGAERAAPAGSSGSGGRRAAITSSRRRSGGGPRLDLAQRVEHALADLARDRERRGIRAGVAAGPNVELVIRAVLATGVLGASTRGSPWLRASLIESARAASRSKGTYLGERYRRLARRRGDKKAIIAIARISPLRRNVSRG